MALRMLQRFFQLEAAGGIILVCCAVLALALANSSLADGYAQFLGTPVVLQVGGLRLEKDLLLFINDFLMAVFFLLVGLEIKREVLEGELSQPSQVMLPLFAAIGGMIAPAAIYALFNWGNPEAMSGWAIPTATDIAFALGVLSLLGSRIPGSLKLFLLALAILDDLGAVIIIALFYTAELSSVSLALAGACIAVLIAMNFTGVRRVGPYMLVGLLLWVSVLKSGVHATLAGVVLGLTIPLRGGKHVEHSPLHTLEHALHPYVAYLILPLFAFANAGLALGGMSLEQALSPVPLGIALGLVLGKPLGVFGLSWLSVMLGIARKPADISWMQLLGVAVLCGIGFTMSLFVASLAFEASGEGALAADRLGILAGSLVSAVLGYGLLRMQAARA